MDDPITLFLIAACALLLIGIIVFFCFHHFNVAVFLIVIAPLFSTLFSSNTPDLDPNPGIGSYLRIGLLGIIGCVGLLKFIESKKSLAEKLNSAFIILGLFLLLAVISSTYSIDSYYTFIRSNSFVALFCFLLGLKIWIEEEGQLHKTMNALFWAILAIFFVNVLSTVWLPTKAWAWDEPDRFQGLLAHPNAMGSFCMISYPILLWKYGYSNQKMRIVLFLLLLTMVIFHFLTGSRTSLASAAIGMFTWFLILKKRTPLILFCGGVVLLIILGMLFQPASFHRMEPAGIADLTGRTDFWRAGTILFKEKPVFGYGFDAGTKALGDRRFYNPDILSWSGTVRASFHNGYLSIAVGIGLPGLLLFAWALFIPCRKLLKAANEKDKALVITILFMCLLANFFETTITGGTSIEAVIFWISWVFAGHLSCSEPQPNWLKANLGAV
jgi:O-antigen ligase